MGLTGFAIAALWLLNRSKRYPTERLQPVLDFCARKAKYSRSVFLKVTDLRRGGIFTGGRAAVDLIPEVYLQLSHGITYPYFSYHVEEVGNVLIQTWEEEVVLTLAHELAHVIQIKEGRNSDAHQMEVGAEMAGVRRLLAWRRNH